MIAWRQQTETLVSMIADLLAGCRHVAVGAQSPIPGTAALLARRESAGALRVSVLDTERHSTFTNGACELFDCAAEGRIDAFFLSGGQIDGQANLNLVGAGSYPAVDVRWPGSFGSAFLYFLVPRVILFREEHSRRVFVEKVDFVSAPGTSEPGVYRPGGPHALVTPLGLFNFNRERARFRLASVHPGHTVEEIVAQTGFDFDRDPPPIETPAPTEARLALMREIVREEVAGIYPRFAARFLG
ncbi:MAG: CoA synthetase [Gammaproteobacteria bacterium]|nr:CoA synthetase [Gammaproteobacteria bacterium]